MVDREVIEEAMELFLEELVKALKQRDIQPLGVEIDPEAISLVAPRGTLFLRVKLPGEIGLAKRFDKALDEEMRPGTMVINLTNMFADVLLLDRDRPQLGFDPAIRWQADRQRKVRKIASDWMAVLDALLTPDPDESRRQLAALGRRLPMLQVEKQADGSSRTVVWYRDGQPVN